MFIKRRQLLTVLPLCLNFFLVKPYVRTTLTEENRAREICKGLLRTEDYAPGFIRLAFHDCIGGCNGCIDLLNPSNKGLDTYMKPLNQAWNMRRVREYMSRADFWILCAREAVLTSFAVAQEESERLRLEEAREQERNARLTHGLQPLEEAAYPNTKSPVPTIHMKFGRVDCHPTISNQSSRNPFPDAKHGLQETLTFFRDNFGFTTRESVALLGAHTLGDAKAESSGFEGTFTDHQEWLDNEYYRDLIVKAQDWKQVNARQLSPWEEPRWQWTRPARNGKLDFVMLNSDVCLVKNMDVDGQGRVNATYQEMKPAYTYPIVEEFARDNSLWIREFSRVFNKMIDTLWQGVVLHRPRR